MRCDTTREEEEKRNQELTGRFMKRKSGYISVWEETSRRKREVERERFWKRTGIYRNFCTVLMCLSFLTICSIGRAEMAPSMLNRIVDAIWFAEGGEKASRPFGILSVSCNGYQDCRRICENTVRNNYRRWLKSDKSKTYLKFLADRYAPVEAHPLNKNWLPNVQQILYREA